MDGDPPAAMRYTEARLSKVSSELLKDIDKETVDFVWNFDDTEKEPTVLPAKFPNLLVNGSTGISAGYATEIPTHNLGEVIDGTVYLIDHPDASLEKLMQFIPGPDFPTGGILQGVDEIKKAYQTGKGKVILRSKTRIDDIKGGKQQIVVSEIPYEVNKANLVKRIDEIRLNKKIDGIAEVRDESDRTGLQIVIELKKEVNAEGILNYLFKNTDLQINYNFNMVAIDEMRPKQVGLKRMLESYVAHRQRVILKRSEYELQKALTRQHIVDGLMKALSILDEVIRTIRQSKDKRDAKNNLILAHQFTQEQAEAIVTLQLYRLTNTDITQLQQEAQELAQTIAELQTIIQHPSELFKVMKQELREVKKQYSTPRVTKIEEEITELKIDTEILVAQEEVMVVITHEGYIKRSSLRSYSASNAEGTGMKDTDYPVYQKQVNTLDHLLMVTDKGNVIYRPVHELPDLRWKEVGEHLSQTITSFPIDENILAVFDYQQMSETQQFVVVNQAGNIKRTALTEFTPWRTYRTRPQSMMKLKSPEDKVIFVTLIEPEMLQDIVLVTNRAYGIRYSLSEVPVVGAKAAGVKAMNLKEADAVLVNAVLVEPDGDTPVVLVTQRGAVKRMLAQELPQMARAQRGLTVLRELKSQSHRVVYFGLGNDQMVSVINQKGEAVQIQPTQFPISDRTSNGSFILDEKQGGQVIEVR